MLEHLINLANKLDEIGFNKQADVVENIIKLSYEGVWQYVGKRIDPESIEYDLYKRADPETGKTQWKKVYKFQPSKDVILDEEPDKVVAQPKKEPEQETIFTQKPQEKSWYQSLTDALNPFD